MAKLAYSKLGAKIDTNVKIAQFFDNSFEVKEYLPVAEKLEIISNVVNYAQDANNFMNPVKLQVYFVLEVMYHYTNISFTDKQKEDPTKLYDQIVSSGLWDITWNALSDWDKYSLVSYVEKTAHNIYDYRNSVYGILDAMGTDYSNLDLDATAIQEKLADKENLGLLRDVMEKLG